MVEVSCYEFSQPFFLVEGKNFTVERSGLINNTFVPAVKIGLFK
jgi:hypothetical protein